MKTALAFLSILAAGVAPAALADPAPGAAETTAVADWMVGTFFGTNDAVGAGAFVELTIHRDGSAIGLIEGQYRARGRVEGDRLRFGEFEFVVTRTDEGIRTTQVGDETNVVNYLRP